MFLLLHHLPPKLRRARRSPICLLAVLALHHGASAALISDIFTAPNNTALIGRLAAPTDIPASTYAGNGNVSTVGGPAGGAPYEADVQSNAARIGADAGVALNLGVAAAAQFQLSISFNITGDTQTQANDAHRGAGFGFFSSVALGSSGSSHGFNNFTGLVVDRTGCVRLIIAGADSGTYSTVAGFDPAVTHTLSYAVNTTAGIGSISSILLDATSVSIPAAPDTFTIARTALAGLYNSSGSGTDLATFDDFIITTVPESGTFAAVSCVTLLICASDSWIRRARKKRA